MQKVDSLEGDAGGGNEDVQVPESMNPVRRSLSKCVCQATRDGLNSTQSGSLAALEPDTWWKRWKREREMRTDLFPFFFFFPPRNNICMNHLWFNWLCWQFDYLCDRGWILVKRDLSASGLLTAATSVSDVTVLPRTEWRQCVQLKDGAVENRNGRMWTLFMAPRTPSPRLIAATVNTFASITAHGSCVHEARGRFLWALFKIPCKHIDWNCQHVLSIREKEIAQYYCCHRWASQLIIPITT